MNTTLTLQELMNQARKLPNGLLRNKLVSRLEDAKIVSELMDYQTGERYGVNSDLPVCTCPQGARDTSCAVHGGAN